MKKITYKDLIESGITEEKAAIIAEKLCEVGRILNSIECDLHKTEFEEKLLIPDKTKYTIWQQIYHFQLLFENQKDYKSG